MDEATHRIRKRPAGGVTNYPRRRIPRRDNRHSGRNRPVAETPLYPMNRRSPLEYLTGIRPFDDPAKERAFQEAFGSRRLMHALVACAVGAFAFYMLSAVVWAIGHPTQNYNDTRIVVATAMTALAIFIARHFEVARRYESPIVLGTVLVNEILVIIMMLGLGGREPINYMEVAPSMIFILVIQYALLRQHAMLTLALGVLVSSVFVYSTIDPDGNLRHERMIVLLFCTNLLGLLMRNTLEADERANFEANLEKDRRIEMERMMTHAISHELRQPLQAAMMQAERLVEALGRGHPENAEAIAMRVEACVRSISGTVDSVLEAAAAESDLTQLQVAPVDLRSLVEDVAEKALQVTVARSAQSGAEVSIRVDCQQVSGCAMTNAAQIERVLGNVLDNAVKYSAPGRANRIELCVVPMRNQYCIEVSDQGIGIEEKDLNRIFDRYVQLRVARRSPGIGLGLSLVRSLIGRLPEHRIDVESHAGEGTKFRIWMPMARNYDIESAT